MIFYDSHVLVGTRISVFFRLPFEKLKPRIFSKDNVYLFEICLHVLDFGITFLHHLLEIQTCDFNVST